MYDLWYAIGAAVMDPQLLDAIAAANPQFTFVPRQVIEVNAGVFDARPQCPSTGLLINGPTTSVRKAIAGYLKEKAFPAPPPIGIACAGRFCQLICIKPYAGSNFVDILKGRIGDDELPRGAFPAYQKAISGGLQPKSPMFPALVGLCLMDGNFTKGFEPLDDDVKAGLLEFGVDPAAADDDWKVISRLAADPDFKSARQNVLLGQSSPWQNPPTCEQFIFWDDFNERAIP
jgi:hypothetical protein